jgi:hypothetical protein
MLETTSDVCLFKFSYNDSVIKVSRFESYKDFNWFINFYILSSLEFRSLGKDSILRIVLCIKV